MKKLIDFFKNGKFEEILGCIAIVMVILPVVANIINRTFFNKYSVSLEASALLAYVWIGYGFFGYMYKKDSHVDVRFIIQKMPPAMQAFFELLRDILIFVFCTYMVYWGYKLFCTNLTRYAVGTKIPLAVGYASIIFGYGTGALRSAWAIVCRLFKKKEGEQ